MSEPVPPELKEFWARKEQEQARRIWQGGIGGVILVGFLLTVLALWLTKC